MTKKYQRIYSLLNFEEEPKYFFRKLKLLDEHRDKKLSFVKKVKVIKGPYIMVFD